MAALADGLSEHTISVMNRKHAILSIMCLLAAGALAWLLWARHAGGPTDVESASLPSRSGAGTPSIPASPPLSPPAPAPVPAPLPDILPEGGIPSPLRIYSETDRPELGKQEYLRAVLKYVLGIELPASAREFDNETGFRMDPEDARKLIERIKELNTLVGRIKERRLRMNNAQTELPEFLQQEEAVSDLLESVWFITSDRPYRFSAVTQGTLEAGYMDCTIKMKRDTILFREKHRPFHPKDRYRLKLDPSTGWGTFHFEGVLRD